MNNAVYQQAVIKSAVDMSDPPLVGWAIGLAGECGEVSEYIKKSILRKSKPFDKEVLALELGDVLWYLTALASECDLKLSDIMYSNIKKLEERQQRELT